MDSGPNSFSKCVGKLQSAYTYTNQKLLHPVIDRNLKPPDIRVEAGLECYSSGQKSVAVPLSDLSGLRGDSTSRGEDKKTHDDATAQQVHSSLFVRLDH